MQKLSCNAISLVRQLWQITNLIHRRHQKLITTLKEAVPVCQRMGAVVAIKKWRISKSLVKKRDFSFFSFITPPGYTGVKQTNQRSTSTKSNTLRANAVSTASVFNCYACSANISLTVDPNAAEPTYDSFIGKEPMYVLRHLTTLKLDQDRAKCWKTVKLRGGR